MFKNLLLQIFISIIYRIRHTPTNNYKILYICNNYFFVVRSVFKKTYKKQIFEMNRESYTWLYRKEKLHLQPCFVTAP